VVLELAPIRAECPSGGQDERAFYVEWPVNGVVAEAQFDPGLVGQMCQVSPRYVEDRHGSLRSGMTLAVGVRKGAADDWTYLGFGAARVLRR
jgi:hypothetical protein